MGESMRECTCTKKVENNVVVYKQANHCPVCGPVVPGERRPVPPAVQGPQGEPVSRKKASAPLR